MSTNLALDGQPNWQLSFNSTDSPEGAYLATIKETSNSVAGTIPLGRTLAPGRYFIAVKTLDYGGQGRLDLRLGGTSVPVTNLNSSGFYGLWTATVTNDTILSATNLQIEVYRTITPLGVRKLYLLKGLYITSIPERVVSGASDAILNLHYPTDTDTNAPVKGNLIENSSFEVGLGRGWGLEEGSGRPYSLRSLWDETVAWDYFDNGTASLRLPAGNSLVSRVYRLKPNKIYTFSAWLLAPQPVTFTAFIESPYELPSGYPPAQKLELILPFIGDPAWVRVTRSGMLPNYPTSEYRIRLARTDFGISDSWIEYIQLEEGNASQYAPAMPVEMGLVSDHASNIFFEDELASMRLLVHNNNLEVSHSEVAFEVYDYLNKKVKEGTTNLVINPITTWSGSLDLTTGKRGFFRVKAWIRGTESASEESCYSVVHHPRQLAVDESSIIGMHADFTEFQLAALQKLGIKWNCTASPSKAFRWADVEPTNGVFQWSSEPVELAASNGLSILGTIGQNWPVWADVGGLPDLDAWTNFVETVVGHYKTQVKYWEIWNEPPQKFSASFYAQLLQRAVVAARRADPQAHIVGLGGSADVSWSTNVLTLIGNSTLTNLTSVSTHLYPKFPLHNYTEFRDLVMNGFSLPLWNTEAAVFDRGSYLGKNSSFLQAEDYAWPQRDSERYQFGSKGAAELLCQNFLHTIGLGLAKYFYYDARIAVGPGYDVTHPTIFEYDDSIRPKGVAYAMLAWLFDHSVGLGNISSNSNTFLYLFDRGGIPLAAFWSDDRAPRTITVGLSPAQFVVYDIMGNPVSIAGSTIPYDGTPVYVEGTGVSLAAFQTAFQAGVKAARADTLAPNLSMQEFSWGVTTNVPWKFRWLAIDDVELPSELRPNAIQYSYRLDCYDTNWSPWSARAFVDYQGVPAGNYSFAVIAKDSAGNISGTNRISVMTGESMHFLPSSLRVTNGQFRVLLAGVPCQGSIVIERSSNLLSWTPHTTNSASGGTLEFIDPLGAGKTNRYYRARTQP